MIAFLLIAACFVGTKFNKSCKCELIEFNTVCFGDERMDYHQVIFWEWNTEFSRYNVRSWVDASRVEQIGARQVRVRGWLVNGDIRFTKTDIDPERENGKLFSCDMRNKMPWDREPCYP